MKLIPAAWTGFFIAKTIEELRQAQAVVLPLEFGFSNGRTSTPVTRHCNEFPDRRGVIAIRISKVANRLAQYRLDPVLAGSDFLPSPIFRDVSKSDVIGRMTADGSP